jgi:hypothetical protein
MVGRILHALDDLGFVRLPVLGQRFDAFIGLVRDRRESLRVAGLASAIGSDLSRVVTEPVWLGFFIEKFHDENLLCACRRRWR